MSLACGTLSYRQAPLDRALEGIRKGGFRFVELGCVCGYCEHVRPEEMTRSDVDRLSKLLREFDLGVISLAGHVDLQYPLLGQGPTVADRGFELLRRRADLAQELGVPIVNSGLGVAEAGENLEPFYARLATLLDYFQQRGVKLGLESHAGLTETAWASLELCRRMNSPALGINYDAANVRFYTGQDPVADLEACEGDLADHLIHVHIKDHAGGRGDWDFPPLGEGNVDFEGLARSFRRIGYVGPYSLEIEFLGPGSTDPTPEIIDAGVAQSYEFMQRLGLESEDEVMR
jgi:L-ribulose-5-phosphate 3-epimerase